MTKFFILFLFLSAVFFNAQKSTLVKITDDEKQAIQNARIILPDKVIFSNDEGLISIPNSAENFEVSAPNFESKILNKVSGIVILKPLYKNIDEVSLLSIDINKIFKEVWKNYDNAYNVEPSLYDIVYKSKSYDNNKLYFTTISDGKWWTKNNKYNWKSGFNKRYDDFLQIKFENARSLNIVKSDSIFAGQASEFSHESFGKYFFNFELSRVMTMAKAKDAKVTAFILNESEGFQTIKVSIKRPLKSQNTIILVYDKKNKAIASYDAQYIQNGYPAYKRKTSDGRDYDFKLGDVKISYSFYLKNGKYIPSLYSFSGDDFIVIENNITHNRKFSTQITYNTFKPIGNDFVLEGKIEPDGDWWKNVPKNKDNLSALNVLTKEEQEFLNQKDNEK